MEEWEEAIVKAKRLAQDQGRTAELRIEIDTHDHDLAFDIMGRPKTLGPGTSTELPGDATLIVEGLTMRKALGFPETIEFVLMFGGAVAGGALGSWFRDKIQGRVSEVRIDGAGMAGAAEMEHLLRRVLREHPRNVYAGAVTNINVGRDNHGVINTGTARDVQVVWGSAESNAAYEELVGRVRTIEADSGARREVLSLLAAIKETPHRDERLRYASQLTKFVVQLAPAFKYVWETFRPLIGL